MGYLEELYKQGLANGVDLKMISREEAEEREPTLRGAGDKVIYSPTTSVMDIHQALSHMTKTLPKNVELISNAKLLSLNSNDNTTAHSEVLIDNQPQKFESKMFINAAG